MVSSRGAFRGEPNHPAYGASKAGIVSLGQSLARALGPRGISVTSVAPGFVETEMAEEALAGEGGVRRRAESPLGRVAAPEEIAAAVRVPGLARGDDGQRVGARRQRRVVPADVAVATLDDARELALALPATTERSSYGTPGFRVKDKLFARSREDDVLVVWVADLGEKEMLVRSDPEKFFTVSHYDGHASVLVRLSAVDREELGELLADAWRARAPKRLLADLDHRPIFRAPMRARDPDLPRGRARTSASPTTSSASATSRTAPSHASRRCPTGRSSGHARRTGCSTSGGSPVLRHGAEDALAWGCAMSGRRPGWTARCARTRCRRRWQPRSRAADATCSAPTTTTRSG